jgi:diguanylate cyclase (GGDEF)-like protein
MYPVRKGEVTQQSEVPPSQGRADAEREIIGETFVQIHGQRDGSTADWEASSEARDMISQARDMVAHARDMVAHARDIVADSHDCLALARDKNAEARDRAEGFIESRAAADRAAARQDRQRAANDRALAASDRAAATADRAVATAERLAFAMDGLTGAYLRVPGFVELEREIARARRTEHPLVLAFVDVDGLKAINDARGHAAGDRMLVELADTLRKQMRHYDLLIRYGGDEFVCVLSGLAMDAASERLASLNQVLGASPEHGSITIGLAELQPDDTPEDLLVRADMALYRKRRASSEQYPQHNVAPPQSGEAALVEVWPTMR